MSRPSAAVVLCFLLLPPVVIADDTPRDQQPSVGDRIEAVLDAPISFSLENVDLASLATIVREECGIPVFLDRKGLDEAKVSDSTPLGLDPNTTEIPLRGIMDLAFRSWDLAYVPYHEVLWFTTRTQSEMMLETRIHDVTDLIYDGDVDSLIELILASIAPTTWSDVGGAGSIKRYTLGGKTLIIFSQTYAVHREAEALLAMLRSVAATDEAERPREDRGALRSKDRYSPSPAVRNAHRRFALESFRAAGHEKGNVLVAPWTIATMLTPVGVGARGTTQRELAKALHVVAGFDEFAGPLARTQRSLSARPAPRELKLSSATGLWLSSDVKPSAGFVESVDRLGVEFKALPNDGELAMAMINRWTSERTDGGVERIFTEPFDRETAMVVVSALRLNAAWREGFDKAATRTATFHTGGGKDVEVHMMSKSDRVGYGKYDGIEILDKPFGFGELMMTVLLPADEDGALAALERSLTQKKLDNWLMNAYVQPVDVQLPRFKLSVRSDLKRALQGMGVHDAFDPERADFSGLSEATPLHLSKLIQQVTVEVNEDGAVGWAAVGGSMAFGAIAECTPKFVADRPFLFLIRDRQTGVILFMGA